MNKIIIALCAFLAVACAEQHSVDGYIKFGRDKIENTLFDYEREIAIVNEHYKEQFEVIGHQKNLVADSITRTQERFTPMEWINGPVKQCVQKYRIRVPNVKETVESVERCRQIAYTQLYNSLKVVTAIKNKLEQFKVTFEKEIVQCGNDGARIYQVISQTIKFLEDNTNSFYTELEAAKCVANVHVKKHMHCVYLVETNIQTLIGETIVQFKKCLGGEENCKPCGKNTCQNAVVVDGNSLGKTLANPLFNRTDKPSCVMVNFEYKNSNKKY